jgi:hypothetical protein
MHLCLTRIQPIVVMPVTVIIIIIKVNEYISIDCVRVLQLIIHRRCYHHHQLHHMIVRTLLIHQHQQQQRQRRYWPRERIEWLILHVCIVVHVIVTLIVVLSHAIAVHALVHSGIIYHIIKYTIPYPYYSIHPPSHPSVWYMIYIYIGRNGYLCCN